MVGAQAASPAVLGVLESQDIYERGTFFELQKDEWESDSCAVCRLCHLRSASLS